MSLTSAIIILAPLIIYGLVVQVRKRSKAHETSKGVPPHFDDHILRKAIEFRDYHVNSAWTTHQKLPSHLRYDGIQDILKDLDGAIKEHNCLGCDDDACPERRVIEMHGAMVRAYKSYLTEKNEPIMQSAQSATEFFRSC